jgi:hypothetical protein
MRWSISRDADSVATSLAPAFAFAPGFAVALVLVAGFRSDTLVRSFLDALRMAYQRASWVI